MPEALLIIDEAGMIRLANSAAAQMFRRPREDLAAASVDALIPALFRAGHGSHVKDFFAHKQRRPMGSRTGLSGFRGDGTEFPVDISLSPVSVGGQVMVTAVVRDLTEQTKREHRQTSRQARMSRLFMSDLVGATTLEVSSGRILEANDTFLNLIQYDRRALDESWLNWDALTPSEHREADQRALDTLCGQGAVPPYEKEFLRRDGQRVPVAVAGSLAPDHDEHAVMLVVDLTARRRAQQELDRTRQRLEDSQRLANVGSAEWNPLENEAWWTEQMYRLFDIPPTVGTLSYERILQRIHPDDRAAVDRALRTAAEHGAPFDFEHRIVTRERTVRWLHNRGNFVPDGTHRRLVGVSQDITDRKKSEQETARHQRIGAELAKLEEMSEFRTRFVSMAAHELKNPLTPMGVELHLLQSESLGPVNEAQRTGLERLQRSYRRITALIQDMLDAARLQGEKLLLAPVATDVSRLVEESSEIFRRAAEQEQIRLGTQITPDLKATIDPQRIGQVLSNLMANAMKFTDPGGEIMVSAAAEETGIKVAVKDSGPGLTPEQIAQLFQPFRQVHTESRKGIRGTGLGLYISKGIIEQHGGRVGATSQGLGTGSTFWFLVPPKPPATKDASVPAVR